ncbi:uncharacterized protein UTRI_02800 [Ustilago trichophora]|uniref:Uncharacterized protein n=1 Tax=Ustilago trichophora TaxID=86804 RepID=A0A5C3ENW4_9BASI|nr:uncharacterized protein UTRI_02800 [Ustilago trichophora]
MSRCHPSLRVSDFAWSTSLCEKSEETRAALCAGALEEATRAPPFWIFVLSKRHEPDLTDTSKARITPSWISPILDELSKQVLKMIEMIL